MDACDNREPKVHYTRVLRGGWSHWRGRSRGTSTKWETEDQRNDERGGLTKWETKDLRSY